MHKSIILILLIAINATIQAASTDVYFGTSGRETKGIYHSKFDTETGKLSPPTLAAEIGSPGFLALHPDGSKLYAVCSSDGPSVAAYRIQPEGKLSAINTEAIGDGGGAHISVHPSGKFLLTAQYGGGSVALFPINEDGAVLPRKQLVEHDGGSGVVGNRQDTPHPHWTGYSPDSRHAFVPDLGMDQILIYKVSAETPAIIPHGHAQSVPGGGPRHMKFSVDGRFIYLLNELSLSVTTFAYDAQTGTTKRRSTTPSLNKKTKANEAFNSASEILTHPNGKFVYSANRGHDSITVYTANQRTGKLKVSEVESIRGSWPRNINLDPTGKWLLAAGAHSNTISIFAIDQETGNLTFQTRGLVNVPGPICILFNE